MACPMKSRFVLWACCLSFAVASGITGQQWPLLDDTAGHQLNHDGALADLQAAVGDRCFAPSPIGQPCYPGYLSSDETTCNTRKSMRKVENWIIDQPGGYVYDNWASCQAANQTCALPPNGVHIPPNQTCYQGSVPSRMVEVHSVADVQDVFAYASKTSKPVVIKNTGHDWNGRSAGPDSIAIWTHRWRDPRHPITIHKNFQPQGCPSPSEETVLRFGPGELWASVYNFAERNNLSVLGGTCGTVGVAGWLHGGGHSPLTPVYGMGADNLREVEVVTPKGDVVVANACKNSKLFSAVRGGGGGTFGVVTKISYLAGKKFEVQELTVSLNNLPPGEMEGFFETLVSHAVDWSQQGWGGYLKTNAQSESIQLVNPRVTLEEARIQMADLTNLFDRYNVHYTLGTQGSWYDYFQTNLEPFDKHLGGSSGAVASRLLDQRPFVNDKGTLRDSLLQLHNEKLNLWIMLVAPTRFNHTTTSALHPSWGRAVWLVRISGTWEPFDVGQAHTQFANVHRKMDPIRALAPDMGASLNEGDIFEKDYKDVFWGNKKYEELEELKDQVDPQNLLSTWHAVKYKKDDPRFRCYVRP